MLEGGHEDVASNRMVRKDSLKKTPTAELPSQFGFVEGGEGQREKEKENPQQAPSARSSISRPDHDQNRNQESDAHLYSKSAFWGRPSSAYNNESILGFASIYLCKHECK